MILLPLFYTQIFQAFIVQRFKRFSRLALAFILSLVSMLTLVFLLTLISLLALVFLPGLVSFLRLVIILRLIIIFRRIFILSRVSVLILFFIQVEDIFAGRNAIFRASFCTSGLASVTSTCTGACSVLATDLVIVA